MKKFIASALFYFTVASTLSAQQQDWGRYWCFGDSAGIDFSDVANPIPAASLMDCAESCTSIGDSINGLLMYAHTDYWPQWILGSKRTTVIHNAKHDIMINGDSLIGHAFHNGLSFITKPGSDSAFYLLQWGFSADSGLYYSEVEPYSNHDTGVVVRKNIALQLNSRNLHMGLITVRHGNGIDWWILVRNWFNSNKFNLFLITNDSIIGPMEQNIGPTNLNGSGGMAVSKQGNRISLVSFNGLVEVYDFDRCSGQISNRKTIWAAHNSQLFGCEFSPNGNLLYVSNTNNIFGGDSLQLFQFDLTSPNPGITYQVLYNQVVPASGGLLKRGPDDKIYFTCLHECGWRYPDSCRNQYNENLGVIHDPDSIGTASNFSPFSFYLGGKRTYWNLPNNPNFLLGPLSGSSCDSLSSSVRQIHDIEEINAWPNPCKGTLHISRSNALKTKVRLFQSDMRQVLEKEFSGPFTSLNLATLSEGIYYLQVNNVTKKIILIY